MQAAKARISKIKPLDDESLEVVQSAKQQKRIPFGALVESGMLKPGTRLFGPARKVQARVRADGSLKLGAGKGSERAGLTGSIHKMGAAAKVPKLQWLDFWHVADGDTLVPIDDLRQKIRRDDS